jgi:hypothetical protein
MSARLVVIAGLIGLSVAGGAPPQPDTLTINGDDQATLLLSGPRAGGWCDVDRPYIGSWEIQVGNLLDPSAHTCDTELITLALGRGMGWFRWKPVPAKPPAVVMADKWSNNDDRLTVPLNALSPREVPVFVRYQSYPAQGVPSEKDLLDGLERAQQIFDGMGCGISFRVVSSTPFVQPKPTAAADCGADLQWAAKISMPGGVNIFGTTGSKYSGEWCEVHPLVVSVGDSGGLPTMAHELGHTLGLNDGEVNVANNLMKSGSNPYRNFLTAGQCFKANVTKQSVLHTLKITDLEPRNCSVEKCVDLKCAGCDRTASPPPPPPVPDTIQQTVETWVMNCDECPETLLEPLTANAAAKAQAADLLQPYLEGSTDEQKTRVRQATTAAVYEMLAYQAQTGGPKFSKVPPSVETFVPRYLSNYDARIKIRAARALGVLKTARARQLLEDAQGQWFFERADVRRELQQALIVVTSPP